MPTSEIISAFTENDSGMVVGYTMYNSLQLTTQVPKTVEIFSSKMEGPKKIGNVLLQYYDLKYTPEVRIILCMLEVLENRDEIQDLNWRNFLRFCEEFSVQHKEQILEQILSAKRYKKETLSLLENVLGNYNLCDSEKPEVGYMV